MHCKCFVCWNRRWMSANQIQRQLAVVLTDKICNQIILFPCYFYRHLFVVLGVLCITFQNFVKYFSCFYTFLSLISAVIYSIFQKVGSSKIYTQIQGHRTRFETFQANNFSWLNYIVFRNQWFLGSWVVEIYARSTIWYFFWSHTASAASNRNCQNSQVFWVKEG